MVKHNKSGRKLVNNGGDFLKASTRKLNKLVKRGKLKQSVGKKTLLNVIKERVSGKRNEPVIKPVVEEKDIPLHEADYDYFSRPGRNYDFLANLPDLDEDKKPSRRKRKMVNDEGLEESYEKKLKANAEGDVEVLPIKIKDKNVYLPKEENSDDENDEEEQDNETGSIEGQEKEEEEGNEESEDVPYIEKYLKKEIKLRDAKNSISTLSAEVLEQGFESIAKLAKIVAYLDKAYPFSVRRCAMVNLCAVFKDIIPDYTIRPLSDAEKSQKMKKDTQELNTFEECLLIQYKKYLDVLVNFSKGHVLFDKNENLSQETMLKQKKILKRKSVEYLGDLLCTHPHFNHRTLIIGSLVMMMFNHDKKTSELSCESIKSVFTQDKSYEVILEIVRLIGRSIKLKPQRIKPKVLDTFLSLKIKSIQQEEEAAPTAEEMRKKNSKMSKSERKKKKQMRYLEKELEQAGAADNTKQKNKLRSEVISVVFLIYFRILKSPDMTNFLPSVLEGLAKFAHLINVTYFSDLFAVLTKLAESGDLSNRESLLCIQTALTLLIDQGSAFNIDPSKFYIHLYKTLDYIDFANFESDLPVALKCLDLMMNKRKKHVSDQRCMAFVKRISMCALKLPPSGALPLLSMIRSIMQNHPKCDLLLDTEGIGSGSFHPEVDNPDHCNAQSSSLYELHILRTSFDPNVALFADHILHCMPNEGAHKLPLSLSRMSQTELFKVENDQINLKSVITADKSKMKKFSKKSEKIPRRK